MWTVQKDEFLEEPGPNITMEDIVPHNGAGQEWNSQKGRVFLQNQHDTLVDAAEQARAKGKRGQRSSKSQSLSAPLSGLRLSPGRLRRTSQNCPRPSRSSRESQKRTWVLSD